MFVMMIQTFGHNFQVSGCPLSSKDLPPEMEDGGSLDREDDDEDDLRSPYVPEEMSL